MDDIKLSEDFVEMLEEGKAATISNDFMMHGYRYITIFCH